MSPKFRGAKWGQLFRGAESSRSSRFRLTNFRQPPKFSFLFLPGLRPATYDLLPSWGNPEKRTPLVLPNEFLFLADELLVLPEEFLLIGDTLLILIFALVEAKRLRVWFLTGPRACAMIQTWKAESIRQARYKALWHTSSHCSAFPFIWVTLKLVRCPQFLSLECSPI